MDHLKQFKIKMVMVEGQYAGTNDLQVRFDGEKDLVGCLVIIHYELLSYSQTLNFDLSRQ